jgi:glucosamine 6-phosphate synthetase-like amidotransferase/phosphosugar isomerase protein
MNAYCDELNLEDKSQDEKKDNLSKICIMHSRYASRKGTMRDNQANPVFDAKNRVAVFHNGFVTNFKDLTSELFPHKSKSKQT